jgi:hypothetical protein
MQIQRIFHPSFKNQFNQTQWVVLLVPAGPFIDADIQEHRIDHRDGDQQDRRRGKLAHKLVFLDYFLTGLAERPG